MKRRLWDVSLLGRAAKKNTELTNKRKIIGPVREHGQRKHGGEKKSAMDREIQRCLGQKEEHLGEAEQMKRWSSSASVSKVEKDDDLWVLKWEI